MTYVSDMSLIDYEVPLNFSYLKKGSRLEEKICSLGKKIFRYISQTQYTITLMIWSYLIIQVATTTSTFIAPPSNHDLEDCQYRMCHYWNNSTKFDSYFPINLESRCSPSDLNYNPFSSFNECRKILCKYTNMIGKNLSECSVYISSSDKFTKLWNKFCPKKKFNKLKKNRKTKFLEKCIERLCKSYIKKNKKLPSFCSYITLNEELMNLSNDIKTWTSTETDQSGAASESVLSITSSTIGAISGLVSIIASAIGCYAAKIAISSVSQAIPTVERGLRMFIDGGLNNILGITETAFETRLSTVQQATAELARDIITVNQISETLEDSEDHFFSFQEEPVVDTVMEGSQVIDEIFKVTGASLDQVIPVDIEGFDQKPQDKIKIFLPFVTQQINHATNLVERVTKAYTQSSATIKPTLSTAEKIYIRLAYLLNQG